MVKGKRVAVLLERAGVEEKGYNWVEAARLYEQAAKSFLWVRKWWRRLPVPTRRLGTLVTGQVGQRKPPRNMQNKTNVPSKLTRRLRIFLSKVETDPRKWNARQKRSLQGGS